MKLITISGVDGSGKSTQIKLLQSHLESQGKKVFYFHAIQFSMAQKITDFKKKYCLICKLLGKCRVKSAPKSVTKANWLQIQLRKAFFRIDIRRFKCLRKKLELDGFDFILSDRYFYDTIVNMEYLMKKSADLGAEKAIIEPAAAIYLEITPEEIMNRDRKPDQGMEYLEKKIALFAEKKARWEMISINASGEKEAVFEKILSHLNSARL